MPKIILKLEKTDIITSKLGENYMVGSEKGGFQIVFDEDALEELLNDYQEIKKSENK